MIASALLLEPQPDLQKKIKKAFCEPGNVAHCPPIVLAREVVLAHGEGQALAVKEARFGSAAQIEEAFASGALHPADLKPAVRDAVEAVVARVRKAVQEDKELAAAEKEMAKVLKRMTSKK